MTKVLNSFQSFEKTVRKVLKEAKLEKDIVHTLKPYFRSFIENKRTST